MFQQIPLEDLAGTELLPQAIIARPISYFSDALGIQISKNVDDFDEFEGAALRLNGKLSFAIKHYAGKAYPFASGDTIRRGHGGQFDTLPLQDLDRTGSNGISLMPDIPTIRRPFTCLIRSETQRKSRPSSGASPKSCILRVFGSSGKEWTSPISDDLWQCYLLQNHCPSPRPIA